MMIDYGDCKKYKYYNVKQEQAMIYKTLHRKLMIGQHELYLNLGWIQVLRKGRQFLFQLL